LLPPPAVEAAPTRPLQAIDSGFHARDTPHRPGRPPVAGASLFNCASHQQRRQPPDAGQQPAHEAGARTRVPKRCQFEYFPVAQP